jgi:hypothetical protein
MRHLSTQICAHNITVYTPPTKVYTGPMKTFKTHTGERAPLPETPFYFIIPTLQGGLIIPCFFECETALLEYWCKGTHVKGIATKADQIENYIHARGFIGTLRPDLIRTAAEYGKARNVQSYRRDQSPRRQYILKSTWNKILKPAREKNRRELLNEQIRKGS